MDVTMSEDDMLAEQFSGLFDEVVPEVDTLEQDLESEAEEAPEEVSDEGEAEAEGEGEAEPEIESVDPEALFKIQVGDEVSHVTVQDLSVSYKDNQARQVEWKNIEAVKQGWLSEARKLMELTQLAKLETDVLLEDSNKTDWNSLSAEDYKATSLQRQRIIEKAAQIKQRMDVLGGAVKQSDAVELQLKTTNAVNRLKREVAGYNDQVYNDALNHGINNLGIDKNYIKSCTDAGVIKLLIEAQRGYIDPVKTKKTTMTTKTVKSVKVKAEPKTGFIDGNPDMPSWAENLF